MKKFQVNLEDILADAAEDSLEFWCLTVFLPDSRRLFF